MQAIMKDPNRVDKLISTIMQAGAEELVVIADFDKTLTHWKNNGKPTSSLLSLLRDGKHLTPEYPEKAQALFEQYHPFEIDTSLPWEERVQLMEEWWNGHHQLLIQCGLNISDLKDIVQSRVLQEREGVKAFLKLLNDLQVPLLIFSASGCGELIPLFIEALESNYSNIKYLINHFQRDDQGNAISALKPVIHALNKSEIIKTTLQQSDSIFNKRKNIILLGDMLGDLGMVEGVSYDHLLTIGFFNGETNSNKADYLDAFDIVLEGDGDFEAVNELFQGLVHPKSELKSLPNKFLVGSQKRDS